MVMRIGVRMIHQMALTSFRSQHLEEGVVEELRWNGITHARPQAPPTFLDTTPTFL